MTDLFGHEEAERQLLAEFKAGRAGQGLIIAGPKGIGKATLAHRFALHALSSSPAQEEAVARRMEAGSHADFLNIEPKFDEKKGEDALEISVEQARAIGPFMSMTPAEGGWRMVIIDPVDALNANAANAILKILEEPPPQAMLILVSHNPALLLPTIRSRCRILKLKVLSGQDFERAMLRAMPEADAGQLQALAALSGHAPGQAVELAAQEALDWYAEMISLLSKLPSVDPAALHSFTGRVAAETPHANWRLVTQLMLFLFERATREASGMEVAPILPEEKAVLRRLAQLHPAAALAERWQQTADQMGLVARRHLDYRSATIAFFHSFASSEGFSVSAA